MKQTLRLLLGLLVMLTPPAGIAQATGDGLTPLAVVLDRFINPDHAPLILAQNLDMFRARGLAVELVVPSAPGDPPELVAAGKADLAISYQPQLYLQVNQGLPLERVGTLIATPLNTLMALEDGPVRDIADLKGRKIGYTMAGFEEVLINTLLAAQGLKAGDVDRVKLDGSPAAALKAGRVDAVVGLFRNSEGHELALSGNPGRAFFPEEHGVPAYEELILIANRDLAEARTIRRFLDALEQAVLYLLNHPQAAWQDFIRKRPALDTELNRRAWADTLPRFALRPAALDNARYRRLANFLAREGLITVALPVSNYAREVPGQ